MPDPFDLKDFQGIPAERRRSIADLYADPRFMQYQEQLRLWLDIARRNLERPENPSAQDAFFKGVISLAKDAIALPLACIELGRAEEAAAKKAAHEETYFEAPEEGR